MRACRIVIHSPPFNDLFGTLKANKYIVIETFVSEFAGFKQIAAETHAEYYFADPYASWQRGTNENTNGLIRQYFPKKCDFRTITDEQIQEAMDKLNNRPRKCLGFRTPNEVFLEAQTVALTN